MVRLIEFLFHGCWHNWETYRAVHFYDHGFGGVPERRIGAAEDQRCSKCNRIKRIKL
jgi:hypothetical protein